MPSIAIPLSLRGQLLSGSRFEPSRLFASNEPGVWYDPSDLSTMFQDTAGTVPVTAAGQSVARINDKSGRGNHATQTTAGARPTYQVDATGRGFLLFDGADDWLVTPTITPGTDKAQVFAGVRKLSDVARATLLETGSNVGQSVRLEAPNTPGSIYYAFTSFGVTAGFAGDTNAARAAPITSVLTGLGDISGDRATLRVNGVQISQATADQGTGNYGNLPLYIGRRGGTTLPFNGRIYGLIVRFGANLSSETIAATEAWMNGKTGAY